MTSKPLHRAGDEHPRAEWPPPTVDDLEDDPDPAEYGPVARLAAAVVLALLVGLAVVLFGLAAATALDL